MMVFRKQKPSTTDTPDVAAAADVTVERTSKIAKKESPPQESTDSTATTDILRCPVCSRIVGSATINSHVLACLEKSSK